MAHRRGNLRVDQNLPRKRYFLTEYEEKMLFGHFHHQIYPSF